MPADEGHARRKGGDVRFRHELMEQARKDLAMTQGDLAKASGMKQPAISLIESGEWPPSLYNAARIARSLKRPLDDFLEYVEDLTAGKVAEDVAVIPREEFEHMRELRKYARALVVAIAKESAPALPGAAGRALKKIIKAVEGEEGDE